MEVALVGKQQAKSTLCTENRFRQGILCDL